MGAPLNRQPMGLLSFLGIKNGGENPRDLIPQLMGVMDLAGLYTIPAAVITVSAGTLTGAGTLTAFGPALQTDQDGWIVHNASLYVDAAGAGDAATIVGGIVDPQNNFVAVTAPVSISVAWGGIVWPEGLLLAPGQALAVRCLAGATFPHPLVGMVRATQLKM